MTFSYLRGMNPGSWPIDTSVVRVLAERHAAPPARRPGRPCPLRARLPGIRGAVEPRGDPVRRPDEPPHRRSTWCTEVAAAVLTNANGLGGPASWITLPEGPIRGRDAGHRVRPGEPEPLRVRRLRRAPSGDVLGTVWVLRGANGLGTPRWEEIVPSGRRSLRRASARPWPTIRTSNRLIVHGGITDNCGDTFSDVWVLTNANGLTGTPRWLRLFPAGPGTVPRYLPLGGLRARHQPAGRVRGRMSTGFRNDAWVLTHANGLGGEPAWIPLKPAGAPPEARSRATAGLARAPFDRMLVGLGQGDSGNLSDVWLLSNPASGAAPEAGSLVARGTIRNDDPLPVVSIEDAPVVTEGNSGTRDAVFTVSLSVPSAETVSVAYTSRDDDAVGGLDYVSVAGVLSIPAGTPSVSLRVPVKGDPFPEADEAFVVDFAARHRRHHRQRRGPGGHRRRRCRGQPGPLRERPRAAGRAAGQPRLRPHRARGQLPPVLGREVERREPAHHLRERPGAPGGDLRGRRGDAPHRRRHGADARPGGRGLRSDAASRHHALHPPVLHALRHRRG